MNSPVSFKLFVETNLVADWNWAEHGLFIVLINV